MPQSVIRFGEFELDSDRYQLRRSGRPQKLERIPMELLTLLVENQGKVVSREAIVDRLWGKDVFLETEHSINTAINKIRRVLRDDPGNPRFVQTVFGKGYRFLAETTVLPRVEKTVSPASNNEDSLSQSGTLVTANVAATRKITEQNPRSQPPQSAVPTDEAIADGVKIQSEDRSESQDSSEDQDRGEHKVDERIAFGAATANRAGLTARVNRLHGPARALVTVLAIVALTSFLTFRLAKERAARGIALAPQKIHSIAVLPLANFSNNPEQEYLVDGMTDQLITDLARATPLRVISRTSTMQYKGASKSLPEIASDLDVDAIVEGSVLPSQGKVRITAQLLDARTDRHLWAQSYERSSQDLLSMQDEVAQDIVHEVAAALQPASQVTHQQKVNPEAYDEYLRGRFLWNRRTLGDLQNSIDHYQKAIRLAPGFAPAYAALGDAYAVISIRGGPPPSESYPRAREAAEKALELDDSLAEAHALLGEVRVNYDHDWDGGEREFRRAVELNPNYPTGHHWYAAYLASMNRPQEAEAEIDKASVLDPLSLIINESRGEIRYLARDSDSAIKLCLHAKELDPNFAETYVCLGKVYEERRQFSEAESNFKRAVDLSGGRPGPLMLQAHANALAGRKDIAIASINRFFSSKHGYVGSSDVASVYCAMGQPSQAVIWLEKAYVNHEEGLTRLGVEPLFDGCRHDPQFQALIQRLHLPQ